MKTQNLTFLLIFVTFLTSAQSVSLTFQVNMSHQSQEGNFDPSSEFVDVAGTFNDWGGTSHQLQDDDGDEIWEITIDGFTAGETIEFKFRINGQWDGREEFPNGGSNRVHTVGNSDQSLSFWYNDEQSSSGPAVAGISATTMTVFTGGSTIFNENAGGEVDTYEWTFDGGTPATSNEPSVEVFYSEAGSYDVSLKVTNSFSEDEILLENYITVSDKNTSDLAWWNEEVFYEIFVRSFYDSDGDGIGDIQGIIEKLDYLNDGNPETSTDLGITGIWLMPIHESPSYHGYDVNDYRSINPEYGTMDDFRELVSEAHSRGIKIIIDLVLNHTSTEIEWFQEAQASRTASKRNWYRWSETDPVMSGPWGQNVWHGSSTGFYYGLFWGGMPDLNYNEQEVKDEMFDITRFWLDDVGIDGYRLDAVKFIKEEGTSLEDLPSTHEFWREWVGEVKQANPDALTVGEAWTNTDKIVPYVVEDGLDFCFEFDLAYAILGAIQSGDGRSFASQVNKVVHAYPYYQFGTFTTNHDMNRLMDELGSDEEKVKLAAAIYLTLPGVPFIYYGEEIGMLGTKPDENIRRPMAWSSESNAGFSSGTPWNDPASNFETNNVANQDAQFSSLLSWYRRLIQLRTSSSVLQSGDYRQLLTSNSSVLAFERSLNGERAITIVNLSGSSRTVTLEVSEPDVVSSSPALVDRLGGKSFDIAGMTEVQIPIEGNTAMVLTPGSFTLGSFEQSEIQVYPNPVDGQLTIKVKDAFEYQVRTIDGKLILQGNGRNEVQVPMKDVKSGTYFLLLSNGQGQAVRKIIVE